MLVIINSLVHTYVIIVDGAEFQLYDASTSLPLNDTTIASYLTLTNLTLDQEGSYKCKGKNDVTNLIGTTEEISIYLNIQGRLAKSVAKATDKTF